MKTTKLWDIDETIIKLKESFHEKVPISEKLINEIEDEANYVHCLLRQHEIKLELLELHNMWLYDIQYCVTMSVKKKLIVC